MPLWHSHAGADRERCLEVLAGPRLPVPETQVPVHTDRWVFWADLGTYSGRSGARRRSGALHRPLLRRILTTVRREWEGANAWLWGTPARDSDGVNSWTITASPVPDRLDSPEAWALHGVAALQRAVERDRWGHDDLHESAADLAATQREQTYRRRVLLVGTSTGTEDVAGYAYISMPLRSNPTVAFVGVAVHPEQRRRGLGSALLAEVERITAGHDRSVLITWTEQAGEPDHGALEPPTGSGRVDPDDPGVRFALHHGFVLEQAERYSVLQLPVPTALVDRLQVAAAERAGAEYRLHTWPGTTPGEWLAQYATLKTRMSTDAPTGGLEIHEDPWDPDRIRAWEKVCADQGKDCLTTAVEHVPTGTLAGFTRLELPLDRPHVVFQEDTLVMREHRGRRLGMLVKAEQLRRLPQVRPDARRIHTWNAEENAHMLGINVALGFRPTGVTGMWQARRR